MAVSYLLTTEQRRLRDRDAALSDAVRLTVSEMGLPADAEPDYWQAIRRRCELVLEMADAAVAARVALEANEARLERHVIWHRHCPCNKTCAEYTRLDRERVALQREADQRFRILLGGRT
jgi:hypothetical protein